MISPSLAFQLAVGEELDESKGSNKALKLALRAALEAFGSEVGCVYRQLPGQEPLTPVVRLPRHVDWDAQLLARYVGERRPPMPADMLVVPVQRRGRPWGVMALKVADGPPSRVLIREALKVGRRIGRALTRVDRGRLSEVRERLDRRIAEQLQPRDLFYHVLHGLHSLTRFDHTASVLIARNGGKQLRVVAETVAWRAGGSSIVGLVQPLDGAARERLESGEVIGFDHTDSGEWQPWWGENGEAERRLAAVLDYNRTTGGEERSVERSLLAAPLVGRDGLTGVIKVACRFPGFMGRYEADLLERFLPHVALALQHLERAAALESGALEVERRSVLADLARGVAHDVNNALGAALPLIQQLRVDLADGVLDAPTAAGDLDQVEASLAVCRRIFGGMLNLARSAAQGSSDGNLRRAVDATLAVLADKARRRAVELQLDLPERLPPVRCPQHDLEQILLNLANNSIDAMPDGGTLSLVAQRQRRELRIELRDTGVGIDPAFLGRVEEPFYSTKDGGNGLGLSIVRAIVTRAGGTFGLESVPGEGTCARFTLPLAVADPEEADE